MRSDGSSAGSRGASCAPADVALSRCGADTAACCSSGGDGKVVLPDADART